MRLSLCHNFRDLGGMAAADGRHIAKRRVFRAGLMCAADAGDADALRALDIVTICDFRTNGERARRPTSWQLGHAIELLAHDYEMSAGVLSALERPAGVTAEQVRAAMLGIYRDLPFEQSHNYRKLFQALAAGKLPLVFNCSPGKDRTGVAAALLLAALGVARADIEADYMRTSDSIGDLSRVLGAEPHFAELVRERPEIASPLLRAEVDYLGVAIGEIAMRCGTVDAYLEDVLGLSPQDRDRLRQNLLV